MKKNLIAGCTLVLLACVTTAFAVTVREYKYRCVRSGKIHTYERPGNYKCPEHPNHNLIPVN